MLGIADQIANDYLQRVKIKDQYIAAACPFHKGGQERKPSFWIHREEGFWGCFTCQESGPSLRDLLRKLEVGSSRVEAELVEAEKDAAKYKSVREAQRRKKARSSFKGEFILPDPLLGVFDFAPIDLLDMGFSEEILISHDIGFDKRNNRMTFPIRDIYGNLVGISGRSTIPGEDPKYLVYNGRRVIDGREVMGELGEWYPQYSNAGVKDHVWRAQFFYDELYKENDGQLILVEGFKAALHMVQNGWLNTGAIMGTKMTQSQERIIRKLGATVFIFTDNNEPGQRAAHYWSQCLANSSFPVYRVYYPDYCEEDAQPDDLSESELEEVLSSSKRVGGNYVKSRMARKSTRRHKKKLNGWRRP